MKRLYVMRHAKSSWDNAALADFERPLNDRGRDAAPFIGSFMRQNGFAPSLIISSPAERARETAELVRIAAKLTIDILFDERIYEASPTTLRQVISAIDDAEPSAMLVGHNPGMEGFIQYLSRQTVSMPTAALAVMDLSIDSWKNINEGCGELQGVYRPKEEKAKISGN